MRFQAAVLSLGAGAKLDRGRSAGPDTIQSRANEACPALDNAIERFRAVAGGGNNPTLADNLRFRLAEALADRADLDPAASSRPPNDESARPSSCWTSPRRKRALPVTGTCSRPTCCGVGKTGRGRARDRRRRQVERPAPPREVVEVNVPLLIDHETICDAVKSLESSQLDKPIKALWMVRVRLAELADCPPVPSGSRSSPTCFAGSRSCGAATRSSGGRRSWTWPRAASSPTPRQPPEVWDALADAYGAAGEPAKAGAAMMRAADRAAALGQTAAAAAYRLRGGGFLFQAGSVHRSRRASCRRPPTTRRGPPAGQGGHAPLPGARPGPGSWACRAPRPQSYTAALEQQLRDFPGRPVDQ